MTLVHVTLHITTEKIKFCSRRLKLLQVAFSMVRKAEKKLKEIPCPILDRDEFFFRFTPFFYVRSSTPDLFERQTQIFNDKR